jgi:hypothetical protein
VKYFQLFIITIFFTFSLASNAFPIPDDNEVSFDVIKKNNWITGQIFHIDGGRSTLRIKA